MPDIDLNIPLHSYLFGFLWADGYIHKKSHIIGTSLKDKSVSLLFYNTFGGRHYIRTRIQEETKAVKTVNEWYVCNTKFCKKIKDLGFRNNINYIPKKNIKYFLLGFLDGDGCIYHKDRFFQVSFSSKKEEDWSWFYEANKIINGPIFTYTLKTHPNKYNNKIHNSSHLRITSSKALKFLDILYEDTTFNSNLMRKKQKYLDFKYRNVK